MPPAHIVRGAHLRMKKVRYARLGFLGVQQLVSSRGTPRSDFVSVRFAVALNFKHSFCILIQHLLQNLIPEPQLPVVL